MERMRDLISIIVPIYKVEDFLCACLDSILMQDYPHWEAILVDDGSPDESGDIADKYANRDGRFKVIHQENGGLSSARNTGLQYAKGNYIMFMDSDDRWCHPQLLTMLMHDIREKKWDILHFGVKEITRNGNRLLEELDQRDDTETLRRKLLMQQIFEIVPNKIYNHHVWKGIFFPQGQILEDFYVMPEVFSRAQKIGILPVVGYAYNRMNERSITATQYYPQMIAYLKGIIHHLELIDQKIIQTDDEVIHKKRKTGVGFAFRILLYYFGRGYFDDSEKKVATEFLKKYQQHIRNPKQKILYFLLEAYPELFVRYAKMHCAWKEMKH